MPRWPSTAVSTAPVYSATASTAVHCPCPPAGVQPAPASIGCLLSVLLPSQSPPASRSSSRSTSAPARPPLELPNLITRPPPNWPASIVYILEHWMHDSRYSITIPNCSTILSTTDALLRIVPLVSLASPSPALDNTSHLHLAPFTDKLHAETLDSRPNPSFPAHVSPGPWRNGPQLPSYDPHSASVLPAGGDGARSDTRDSILYHRQERIQHHTTPLLVGIFGLSSEGASTTCWAIPLSTPASRPLRHIDIPHL